MRSPALVLLVPCFLAACAEPASSKTTSATPDVSQLDWWSAVFPRIDADSRKLHTEGEGIVAHLSAFTAEFRPDGVRTGTGPTFALRGVRDGDVRLISQPTTPRLGACANLNDVDPTGKCLQRAEYARGAVTEWWAATPAGIEQGFDIFTANEDELTFEIETSFRAEIHGDGLTLHGTGQRWKASPIVATDVDGASLPAHYVATAAGFEMVVDVSGAHFPVRVDPVYEPEIQIWEGGAAADVFGTALAGGGDVNGDGYGDVLVGASNANSGTGAAYLYLGAATGLGTIATELSGSSAGDLAGATVAFVGDLNADGFDEIAVGAPAASGGAGKVWVYEGSAAGPDMAFPVVVIGDAGVQLGSSIAGLGDIDADGYDDFAMGGPGYDGTRGYIVLAHGNAGSFAVSDIVIADAEDMYLGDTLVAGDLNGDGVFDLVSGSANGTVVAVYDGLGLTADSIPSQTYMPSGGSAGTSLLIVDVTGDGRNDLVVGQASASVPDGRLSAYYAETTFPDGTEDWAVLGATGSLLGASLANGGDLEGDGVDDILAGGPDADTVYVYRGTSAGPSSAAVALNGGSAGDAFGSTLASVGDIDGDGRDDFLVGSPEANASAGAVSLYFGTHTSVLASAFVSPGSEGAAAQDRFGYSLAVAGDVNADGFDDVVVGAYENDTVASGAGAAYVFHGSATGLGTTAATALYGEAADDHFGNALDGAGDVNADGFDDVVVGASTHDSGGSNAGRAYVFHGSAAGVEATATTTITGTSVGGQLGASVAGIGKMYGGSYADVAIGAPYASSGLASNGVVRVYRGSASGLSTTVSGTWVGATAQDWFGTSVAGGDLDDNGYSDLVVGAYHATVGGTVTGAAYVVYGKEYGPATTPDVTLSGTTADARFGSNVAVIGDIDDNGVNELLVAEVYAGSNAGAAHLYAGATAGLDSTAVYTASGDATGDYYGVAIGGGDSDGNGRAELVVGAFASDAGGNDAGTVYVSDLDRDFIEGGKQVLFGEAEGDYFGYGVASGGDLNGDGFDDLVVGAFGADALGSSTGSIQVFYGAPADADGDGVWSDVDCDDHDEDVGVATSVYYNDNDGDGEGVGDESDIHCVQPPGKSANGLDCNDSNDEINTSATEVCDDADTDEDCNGEAEDENATGMLEWFADVDGDGFGDAGNSLFACDEPPGFVEDATDCDDTRSDVSPLGTEVCDADNRDEDCDGNADDEDANVVPTDVWFADADDDDHGDPATAEYACDQPNNYVSIGDDCDDSRGDVSPSDAERCDDTDVDEDCDGLSDDDDASVSNTEIWYLDGDSDGFVDMDMALSACEAPTGYTQADADCDDSRADVNPFAIEVCDPLSIDEDCDLAVNDADSSVTGTFTYYADADGDGYGDSAITTFACTVPAGYAEAAADCDDGDGDYHPGAAESDCTDTNDYNCDGSAAGEDADGDSYVACLDCDDGSAAVHSGAVETCNSIDDDCDGEVDGSGAVDASTWYADDDGDGYTDPWDSVVACDAPSGYQTASGVGDCDDTTALRSPALVEVSGNALDEDCDGIAASGGGDTGDSGWDSGDTGSDSGDTGRDTSADSGVDSGDSARDTSVDTSGDSGVDTGGTGIETGDSGRDTSADTSGDTGSETGDTGTDTDTDSGSDAETGGDADSGTGSDTDEGAKDDAESQDCGCEGESSTSAALFGVVALAIGRRRRLKGTSQVM